MNKAFNKDVIISDIVVRAKSSSEAWKALNSMAEDRDSD